MYSVYHVGAVQARISLPTSQTIIIEQNDVLPSDPRCVSLSTHPNAWVCIYFAHELDYSMVARTGMGEHAGPARGRLRDRSGEEGAEMSQSLMEPAREARLVRPSV